MHQNDQNMSSSPSTCYSPPPLPSTTSSDNNAPRLQQQQQHGHYPQSLSSLESFLFLPQLPVDGDDGDEDAWLFPRYPRQQNQQERPSPQQQQQQSLSSSLLAIVNPTTKSSRGIRTYNNSNNPSSFTDRKNEDRKTSCNNKQRNSVDATSFIPILTARRCHDDDHDSRQRSSLVCGVKPCNPTNSLFPFIATNDTVIAAASSNKSNNDDASVADVVVNNKPQQQKLASSMNVHIKNTRSGDNGSHNYSTSPPFYLAANHYHRQEKHSHDDLHQPHSHYRHIIRRRWFIFRICQASCVLLCMLFLFNLVKNSIWSNDEYENKFESLSSSLTSSSPSFRVHNRLIQSWNMPSILSPSRSSSSKIPEILSVVSAANHLNDDRDEVDDDSNMHKLMLLGVPNFKFLINNKTKCNIPRDDDNYFDGGGSDDDGTTNSTIFFMIIVHSAPQNVEERNIIRETWGKLERLGVFHIRLVFLLGHEPNSDDINDYNLNSNKSNNNITSNNHSAAADDKEDRKSGGSLTSNHDERVAFSKIQQESKKYGDIVTGNFHDSYRNITLKHLMGYLWVLNHCSHAKYVLKADDDAFIDIFQLFEFLIRTFGKDPEPALICNVFPEGTKPVRGSDVLGKKWAVTYAEYPYEAYPKYCGGLAYLVTPDVIHEIYRVSQSMKNKYLWIDDVYVTGLLRERAHVEPFYLNLRYSYDPEEYRKWLTKSNAKKNYEEDKVNDEDRHHSITISDSVLDNEIHDSTGVVATAKVPVLSNQMKNDRRPSPPQKLPFMIVHMERGSQLGREMKELWNKTMNVWSGSGVINLK